MKMSVRVLVWLACFLPLGLDAQQSAAPDTTLTLAVRFFDGRVVHHAVGLNPGSSWTPMFPRVFNWKPPAGELEVTALKLAWMRVNDDVEARVSLLRGRPHQQETPVATAVVRSGTPVVIDALRIFGVEPVQLSIAATPRPAVGIPQATSDATGIVVLGVEVATSGALRYLITVQNTSTLNLRAFTVDAFREGQSALSGRRAGTEGRPIIEAGATYTFDLPVSLGTASNFAPSARPADHVRIGSALWADGSVGGNAKKALETIASDYGNYLQLASIADAHRRAAADAPVDPRLAVEQLRATLTSLPIEPAVDAVKIAREAMRDPQLLDDDTVRSLVRIGMQSVKTAALKELSTFETTAPGMRPDDVARALAQTADRYTAWRARLQK